MECLCGIGVSTRGGGICRPEDQEDKGGKRRRDGGLVGGVGEVNRERLFPQPSLASICAAGTWRKVT